MDATEQNYEVITLRVLWGQLQFGLWHQFLTSDKEMLHWDIICLVPILTTVVTDMLDAYLCWVNPNSCNW